VHIEALLPYLLGGGAVTAIIAALSWGRKDAKDSIESASSNVTAAMSLRDQALADYGRLRDELKASLEENETLRRRLRDAGHGDKV
jgi:hypothetical protein